MAEGNHISRSRRASSADHALRAVVEDLVEAILQLDQHCSNGEGLVSHMVIERLHKWQTQRIEEARRGLE